MDAAQEKALLDSVETLKTELAAKTKQLDGLQDIFKTHGTELGDVRKKIADIDAAKTAVETLKKDLETKLAELDELKKNFKGSSSAGGQTKKVEDMSADEIEDSFTPEQRKTVEGVYSRLPDDDPKASVDKKRIASDPVVRKKFFAAALEEVPSIPSSPWKKPGEQKKPEDEMRALFKTEHKRSTFVPPGPSERSRGPIGGGLLQLLKNQREEEAGVQKTA